MSDSKKEIRTRENVGLHRPSDGVGGRDARSLHIGGGGPIHYRQANTLGVDEAQGRRPDPDQ